MKEGNIGLQKDVRGNTTLNFLEQLTFDAFSFMILLITKNSNERFGVKFMFIN